MDEEGDVPSLQHTLFICTTPRTGGHYFCDKLATAGLGRPTEYFGPQIALPLFERWNGHSVSGLDEVIPHAAGYGEKLLRLRSPKNIFSAKVFLGDMRFVRKCFPAERLQHATYVLVVRKDIVAQTISLLALLSTKHAFDSDEVVEFIKEIDTIDLTVAERTMRWILRQNDMWGHFLSNRPNVLWTDMETIILDGDAVAQRIADKMSIQSGLNGQAAERPRYNRDVELKMDLHHKFGPHLECLLQELTDHFIPPPNALRVC